MEKEQININKEVTIALQQWSKNIERVPEGYFEGAPQQVLQAIKKKKTTLIYTLSKLSVAAIFIAIIANVYFIHNSNINSNKVNTIAIQDLSNEEIETYLTKNDMDVTAIDDNNLNSDIENILNQSQDSLNN